MVSLKKSSNKHFKRAGVLLASVFVLLSSGCDFTSSVIFMVTVLPDDAPESSETTPSEEDYPPTFELSDENGDWSLQEELDIFYNETFGSNMIAPGLSGSYTFNLLNTNEDDIIFSFYLEEDNEFDIAMVYKLDRDNESLIDKWTRAADFKVEGERLEAKASTSLTLYWYWDPDVNDEADTKAATEGMTYSLSITIDAYVAKFDD